jgi:hypothetical protein
MMIYNVSCELIAESFGVGGPSFKDENWLVGILSVGTEELAPGGPKRLLSIHLNGWTKRKTTRNRSRVG